MCVCVCQHDAAAAAAADDDDDDDDADKDHVKPSDGSDEVQVADSSLHAHDYAAVHSPHIKVI